MRRILSIIACSTPSKRFAVWSWLSLKLKCSHSIVLSTWTVFSAHRQNCSQYETAYQSNLNALIQTKQNKHVEWELNYFIGEFQRPGGPKQIASVWAKLQTDLKWYFCIHTKSAHLLSIFLLPLCLWCTPLSIVDMLLCITITYKNTTMLEVT